MWTDEMRHVDLSWRRSQHRSRPTSRVFVRRILREHDYSPDKQEKATRTVLEQVEVLSEG
jgi:hypothetical protein